MIATYGKMFAIHLFFSEKEIRLSTTEVEVTVKYTNKHQVGHSSNIPDFSFNFSSLSLFRESLFKANIPDINHAIPKMKLNIEERS